MPIIMDVLCADSHTNQFFRAESWYRKVYSLLQHTMYSKMPQNRKNRGDFRYLSSFRSAPRKKIKQPMAHILWVKMA